MRRGGGGDDNQSGEAAAEAASLSRSLAVPLPVFHVSGNGLEAMILTSRRPSCIPTPFPLPHRGEGGSQSGVRGENRGGEKAERPSAARKAGDT